MALPCRGLQDQIKLCSIGNFPFWHLETLSGREFQVPTREWKTASSSRFGLCLKQTPLLFFQVNSPFSPNISLNVPKCEGPLRREIEFEFWVNCLHSGHAFPHPTTWPWKVQLHESGWVKRAGVCVEEPWWNGTKPWKKCFVDQCQPHW